MSQPKIHRKWAKLLLDKLAKTKDEANKDTRSTAEYWNGDGWGSMSGQKDALEWVENRMIDCILKYVKSGQEYETGNAKISKTKNRRGKNSK